jgi:hypothetical protein
MTNGEITLAVAWITFFFGLAVLFAWAYVRPFGFSRRIAAFLLFELRILGGASLASRLPSIIAELSAARSENELLSRADSNLWRRLRLYVRLVSGSLAVLVLALLLTFPASLLVKMLG